MIVEPLVPAYRTLLERFLLAADALQREETLLAASELAKTLLNQRVTMDDILALHQRAQQGLAEDWAVQAPGTAQALAWRRLAAGDAMPLMLAALLPQQLDEQTRAERLEEGVRQNDRLRAVATLAAGIAHDFNNLLGSIVGLTELSELQAAPGSALARNLGGIRQASQRAADLVAQLLSFARERPLHMQAVTLGALLQGCEPLLSSSLPKGVVLHMAVLADAQVQADSGQIEQVLLNLVKNAGYAMRACGGTVRVMCDQVPLDGQHAWARLRVIDQGEGIPAEALPRIFDPFFTTKPVDQGTGLGLAAAHGIVRHHGGQLEVESVLGGPTVFSLCLPLIEAPTAMPLH